MEFQELVNQKVEWYKSRGKGMMTDMMMNEVEGQLAMEASSATARSGTLTTQACLINSSSRSVMRWVGNGAASSCNSCWNIV